MPLNKISYDNTHFYKIVCKNIEINDIYVGHTTNFRCRKNQHKTTTTNQAAECYNSTVYRFIRENGGWINFDMILIETTKCDNKLEAEKIERKYIEELYATLNSVIPWRSKEEKQEYKHNWCKDNRERNIKAKKESYISNREERLDKSKKYYEENNEKCKEWKNGVITCECGNKFTNANKARHFKTKTHIISSSSSDEIED